MNCPFDKEKLSGYYDGELEAAEKAEVERHIASCSECLRELGELKSAALLVKELPRLRAPRSIAEGIASEIQSAGRVHSFERARRVLLWCAAAAAAGFVAVNVAYFSKTVQDPKPMALSVPPAKAVPPVARMAPADEAKAEAPLNEEAPRRRSLDRGFRKEAEQQPAAEELRKNATAAADRKDAPQKGGDNLRERAAAAAATPAAPKPQAEPAPSSPPAEAPKPGAPPAPPAAVAKAPEPSKPVPDAAEEKAFGQKKETDSGAKADADARVKKLGSAETSTTHLTLASTQMAKARPQLEDALRKMEVRLPPPPPLMKAPKSASRDAETSVTLELTDAQIAKLQSELSRPGQSLLVPGMPGDPVVLSQFSDTGLFRGKGQPSGGAVAPARKATPDPARPEPKEKEKDGKDAEDAPAAKAPAEGADKAGGRTAEARRKVVIHLVEVPILPEAQPAADPVKK